MGNSEDNKVITLTGGISSSPSDLTCKDTELEECLDMVNINDELIPLQDPLDLGVMQTSELKRESNVALYGFNRVLIRWDNTTGLPIYKWEVQNPFTAWKCTNVDDFYGDIIYTEKAVPGEGDTILKYSNGEYTDVTSPSASSSDDYYVDSLYANEKIFVKVPGEESATHMYERVVAKIHRNPIVVYCNFAVLNAQVYSDLELQNSCGTIIGTSSGSIDINWFLNYASSGDAAKVYSLKGEIAKSPTTLTVYTAKYIPDINDNTYNTRFEKTDKVISSVANNTITVNNVVYTKMAGQHLVNTNEQIWSAGSIFPSSGSARDKNGVELSGYTFGGRVLMTQYENVTAGGEGLTFVRANNLDTSYSGFANVLPSGTSVNLDFKYVHEHNNYKHYIGWYLYETPTPDEYLLTWHKENSSGSAIEYGGCICIRSSAFGAITSEPASITHVGNTLLMVVPNKGIRYFLWVGTEYKDLGYTIPDLDIELMLSRKYVEDSTIKDDVQANTELADQYISNATLNNFTKNVNQVVSLGSYDGILGTDTGRVMANKQDDYNNLIYGLYAKNKKYAAQRKGFVNPFFVRYAIELYDGTYYKISQPILMLPSTTKNSYALRMHGNNTMALHTEYSLMYYKSKSDYSEWKDIVKNVVLFVSDDIDIYDTNVDALGYEQIGLNDYVSDGVASSTLDNTYGNYFHSEQLSAYIPSIPISTFTDNAYSCWKVMNGQSAGEMADGIKNSAIFYKICEIGAFEKSSEWMPCADKMRKSTLQNLTTQPQLVNDISGDDYYSHCNIIPSKIFSFNRRLHLYGATRDFFKGWLEFVPMEYLYNNTKLSTTKKIAVYIKTGSGEKCVIQQSPAGTTNLLKDYWFFYPDERAYKAEIYIDNNLYYTLSLKVHPHLHGAYYYGGLPTSASGYGSYTTKTPVESCTPEELNNQVIVSDVDNPFSFGAKSYITIGTGSVIGLASLTTALSQGQFGSYPTIAFTNEGIWAMHVDSDGTYSSVVPFSREVCCNENSIIATDGAIFFASNKGMMAVTGTNQSGSGVDCVSKQLQGKKNGELMTDLLFATCMWDYKERLLIVVGPVNCWVYSLSTGTWSQAAHTIYSSVEPSWIVSSYPDYLFQTNDSSEQDHHVWSLINRPNRGQDSRMYGSMTITSRPLKLSGSLIMDTIMRIKHLLSMTDRTQPNPSGSADFTLYASDDLKDWFTMSSLRGKPWKFYKIKYTFSDWNAVDSYSGTVITVQPRRIDKIR